MRAEVTFVVPGGAPPAQWDSPVHRRYSDGCGGSHPSWCEQLSGFRFQGRARLELHSQVHWPLVRVVLPWVPANVVGGSLMITFTRASRAPSLTSEHLVSPAAALGWFDSSWSSSFRNPWVHASRVYLERGRCLVDLESGIALLPMRRNGVKMHLIPRPNGGRGTLSYGRRTTPELTWDSHVCNPRHCLAAAQKTGVEFMPCCNCSQWRAAPPTRPGGVPGLLPVRWIRGWLIYR